MKRITFLFAIFFCVMFLVLNCKNDEGDVNNDDGNGQGTLTWNFVDGNTSDGISFNSSNFATSPSLEQNNSSLYLAWSEEDGSYVGQIRVAKWDGSNAWTFIDGNSAVGINRDSTHNASSPKLESYNGELFATWSEIDGTTDNIQQIRVAKYSAPSNWIFKDGNAPNAGINRLTAKTASTPDFAVFSSELFATWNEYNSSDVAKVRVAAFDSSDDTWDFVDVDTDSGLNKNVSQFSSERPSMLEFNSELFVIFSETAPASGVNQIRVRKKIGASNSWSFVDGSDSTDDGINYSKMDHGSNPVLCVFESKLYAAWEEVDAGSIGQIRVAEWDGNQTWNFIDGSTSEGLRKNNSMDAESPVLVVFHTKLYSIWSEDNGTAYQIRVARWEGGQSWTFVDGDGSNGLNHNTSEFASYPTATVLNSKLYIAWEESNGGSIGAIRVLEGSFQ